MAKVLEYLNEGYDWIVDFDIEKFFDTVNQDKLIVSVNCGYINKNYTILYHKNRMVIFNENS